MISMFLPAHKLELDISRVLTYFDIFDYPLTSLEIWQLLPIRCSYDQVLATLPSSPATMNNGFYCLYGREEIIITRQQRYNIADRKFKKALRLSRLFALLPWIKLIALVNLIGQHNLKAQGDIDLFIVTNQNRLWLTRLLCVGFLKLLRLRPTPQHNTDTICLSFLIDDSNLNLEPFLLQQATDNRDRYFTYWLANLHPLYNRNQTYDQLIIANNWLRHYLPNWQPKVLNHKRQFNKKATTDQPWAGLNYLDNLAKRFQYWLMAPAIKAQMNQNTQVVINDHVLKLHVLDRREQFYQQYLNKLQHHV